MSTSPTSNNTTFFDDWSGQDLKSTSNVTITPTTYPWSIATLPFANSEAVDVSPTHDVSPQACQPPTSISPPNLYPKRPCSSNAEIEAPMLKQPVTRKRGCPRLNRTVIVSSGDSGKSAVKSHKTRIPHTEVERKYRRFPLTQENLRLLENQTSSAMSASRTSSRSRSNLDNRNKLGAYRILIDKGYTCPPDLERHIQNVVRRPWPSPSSQNAKKVVEKRRVAAQQNERGGIKQIEPYLLFRGEAEADDRVSGVPFIYSKDEINLARSFLPSAPNANITQTWGDLSQPRPDTAIGYITRGDAENTMPPSQTAFSPEEDEVLDGYRLSPYFHFPFLTSQWETPNSNQNHSHAHNQAGRDGAVIVNHLHEFYSVAYGCEREPTVVETCHFSLTCDLLNGNIFAHWRDQDVHHMELLYEFSLRKEAEVQQARQMLWNILDYAVGERLQSIKAALPAFARNRGQFRPILESTVAGSEASSLGSHSCVQFQTP